MINCKKVILVFGMLLFLITTVCITPAISGSISPRDEYLIKIAYMNGYLEAMKLNEEEMAELNEDTEKLKKKLESTVRDYLKKIHKMNP